MTDFEKLFEDNSGFIFKYLLKMTRDSSLAEELTQETFFRAYINYPSLRMKEKAVIWLCTIAKNTYFAWYNEHKKLDSYERAELQTEDEGMENAFIERELSKNGFLCLNELEEPYKEVFMLAVLGGVSLKEISGLYGRSESWARVTFYRAKQKIRERMEEIYGV